MTVFKFLTPFPFKADTLKTFIHEYFFRREEMFLLINNFSSSFNKSHLFIIKIGVTLFSIHSLISLMSSKFIP